ncbi:ABC transporter substrate-binding protein [Lentzea kentuckyensis]|uniref:ABC transporter substrate-binding protein n=1 Tax=Lentzea kentuckyensis TaxID=360086 RepID=UPI000A375BBB|nr:ABC transporter substrate-binding protein [Lentzea kentuckyensis]
MSSRRISRFSIALVLLCATACTSTATSTDKITLGLSAWPGWFPWQVAQEQGFFKRNGVDVELKYFDSYTDSLNALSSGAIDANSQTLNDTIASVSGGAEQTIVLVNDNSTGNDQVIAREGISGVADLKGKKVAVEQGTVDHYLLLLALTESGLSQKDVELVPLATDAAAAAFVAGKVDAVGAFAPFTTTALQRAGSHAIATSAEFPGAIPDHLVVSGAFAKNRADAAQALVNTWFDTLDWIKQNNDQAVEIMAKRGGVSATDYRGYDAGTTIFTLRQNIDAFTPGVTPTHLNHQAGRIADFLVNTGLTQKRPSLDGLFDDRFVKAVHR